MFYTHITYLDRILNYYSIWEVSTEIRIMYVKLNNRIPNIIVQYLLYSIILLDTDDEYRALVSNCGNIDNLASKRGISKLNSWHDFWNKGLHDTTNVWWCELDHNIDIFDVKKKDVDLILSATRKLEIWGCDGQNFNSQCLHYLKR